ncbi:hypothetical protein ACH518_11480 [Methylomonas sp. HW2-6]|uniref:hypothetical protein n=1 Tax=Methylomonas sp. HW2-6 TaxID=3376687 RepID=UPI004041B2FB
MSSCVKNLARSLLFIAIGLISTTGNLLAQNNQGSPTQSVSGQINPPKNIVNQVETKAHEGVTISRDEVSFYSSVFQLLSWFIPIITVLFGGIVGINVYQGNTIITDAKKDLKDLHEELLNIKEARKKYDQSIEGINKTADQIVADALDRIRNESASYIESVVKKHYEITHISNYKNELLSELEKDNPDENYIYIRLTDCIRYCDENLLKIYSKRLTTNRHAVK